jgi:hypothetical protein
MAAFKEEDIVRARNKLNKLLCEVPMSAIVQALGDYCANCWPTDARWTQVAALVHQAAELALLVESAPE